MPDGQSILAQGPDGLIRWDWRTGKKLHSYSDSTGPIAFLDGGKAMAVQGWQSVNSLWVLDTATGKNVCPLPRPGDRVAYSPDSRLIAWSEADALVLADAATGKQIRRWPAHEGGVAPLTFAPDGKTLASAGGDNRIRLWDVHTGTEIRSMEQSGSKPASLLGGRQTAGGGVLAGTRISGSGTRRRASSLANGKPMCSRRLTPVCAWPPSATARTRCCG